MYKIIGADKKEYGPISPEVLRQWMAEGRVNAETQVLPEGATEWKALGTLPEFAASTPTAPPVFPAGSPYLAPRMDEVNGPAIGLMITAILGFLLQVTSLVWSLAVGSSFMSNYQMPNQEFANMFSGVVGAIFNSIGILVSGLILFGAIKMRKLENYGLAMTTSILAMIPCISPCCLIGLPIGIWAVVVLSKPEVKSAFH